MPLQRIHSKQRVQSGSKVIHYSAQSVRKTRDATARRVAEHRILGVKFMQSDWALPVGASACFPSVHGCRAQADAMAKG